MESLELPIGYSRIRCVSSFEELCEARFEDGVNALCLPRLLQGDFEAVARALEGRRGLCSLDETALLACELTTAGQMAARQMLEDVRLLSERGLEPELNYVERYQRDERGGAVATDLHSFHVDRAPIEVDTWLCTYRGAPSEGLRNDQAVARVDVDETRSALLREFGGRDGAAFRHFLTEHSYDLHYAALPGAAPWSFGVGHLWRLATTWPGAAVPPCIHRAPTRLPDVARLLFIS